jgi:hypothetical protein
MLLCFRGIRVFLKVVVNILHLFDDIIIELDVLARILEYLLTDLSKFELPLDLLQNIADHELNTFGNYVQIVVFVQLVAGIKDVLDSFYILRGITNLLVDYLSLIKK